MDLGLHLEAILEPCRPLAGKSGHADSHKGGLERGPESGSKKAPCWYLPGGRQKGSLSHDSSIFTFLSLSLGASLLLFLGHRRRQQAAKLGTCFRGCFFRVLGGLTEFAIGVCVWLTEFAVGVCVCGASHPQGRREGGEEEVLRRLLTPKGVGGFLPWAW